MELVLMFGIPFLLAMLISFLIIAALTSFIRRNNAQIGSEQSHHALIRSLVTGQSEAVTKLAALETSMRESHDRLTKIETVLKTVE